MSRFLLLLVFVLWKSGWVDPSVAWPHPVAGPIVFLGGYLLFLLALIGWAYWITRPAGRERFTANPNRFNILMNLSRWAVVAWFGVGVTFLQWQPVVDRMLSPIARFPVELPSLMLGCLPAFIAWMGLWLAQFPADRALRDHALGDQLALGATLQPPLMFWSYLGVKFRLQFLFTIVPIVVLFALRDTLILISVPLLHRIPWFAAHDDLIELMISIPSLIAIFILSPAMLKHVLKTEPLPDSPLRRRLESVCRRARVGYTDILLWHTEHFMGNAAVMGFIPQVRYVLLSDLLLETMTDEQIEAVFAHELGHVIHRHLFWLAGAVLALLLAFSGPGQMAVDAMLALQRHIWLPPAVQAILLFIGALGLFALVFGYVSRRCERQADVFAARTLQETYEQSGPRVLRSIDSPAALMAVASQSQSQFATSIVDVSETQESAIEPRGAFPEPLVNRKRRTRPRVGPYGAEVFASALRRIAVVNDMPVGARSWSHGSIACRMKYLKNLAKTPHKTVDFDRSMKRTFWLVILGLCVFVRGTVLVAMAGN